MNITPDSKVLAQIFPSLQPTSTKIFVQTWWRCIFVARFDEDGNSNHSWDRIIRLETPNNNFHVIAALERLASLALPDLVPKGYQIGTVTDTSGRTLDFSITQFIEGVTLQDVWTELGETGQDSIMKSIIDAVQKLQSLRLDDTAVQKILKETPYCNEANMPTKNDLVSPGILGGPHLGYFTEGKALLDGTLEYRKIKTQFCTIESDVDGDSLSVRSFHEALGSKQISRTEYQSWQSQAVFCHNDLHPGNIIVQQVHPTNWSQGYKLVAIIDWEIAGFFPFAYELSLQDTLLGTGNMFYSWYKLFTKHAQKQLSFDKASQASLLQAMNLIFDSQQKCLVRNIPACIRRKWLGREKLVRATNIFDGWERRSDAGEVPQFTAEDNQKLEDDELRERGII